MFVHFFFVKIDMTMQRINPYRRLHLPPIVYLITVILGTNLKYKFFR